MKEIILDHPLVKHKMAILRNADTNPKDFRELVNEIAMLITYEAMRGAATGHIDVITPMGKAAGHHIDENNYVLAPVLRAGLGMVDGASNMLPNASIGHIGLHYCNDETDSSEDMPKPVSYYFKMPATIHNKTILLLDPMLATGGSAAAAITQLKESGAKEIKFLCIIAAPEGIARVKEEHPDVQIYAAALDDCLNDIGYIVPGLGDAGDRIFATAGPVLKKEEFI